jgi:hypothetical protein
MPLQFVAGPANGANLVHEGLGEVLARRSPLSGLGVAHDEVSIDRPHEVYDLRADELANGATLDSARLSGYRYLVGGGDSPVAAGEVLTDANGEASVLANLNYGRFVQATADALAKVERVEAVGRHPYTVRLLRCAAIYVMALWLKADGEPDIVFPLAPAPPPLEAERPYSADEFLAAIVPLARTRAAGNQGRVP